MEAKLGKLPSWILTQILISSPSGTVEAFQRGDSQLSQVHQRPERQHHGVQQCAGSLCCFQLLDFLEGAQM